MNVLHYSFSLSACPKCHLLICKHTSLADLDFNSTQQQSVTECNDTTISIEDKLEHSSQQRSFNGTNFYIFPSTTFDNRHSWTTFGSDSIENTNTSNNETICENVPFANENILNSRTQSERIDNKFSKSKSFSLATIYHKSTIFPHIKHETHSLTKSYSTISFLLIMILILSFIITNTIDIVLCYVYYYTNYIYLISFISTIILCDLILGMNNLIKLNSISSYLLLIPFSIRFYLLYKLIELLLILFDKHFNRQIIESSLYKLKKQKLFHYLALFHLIHTGFFALINLYFWSNNFHLSTKSLLNMDSFIPQWIFNNDLSSSTSIINTITTHSSLIYSPDKNEPIVHRTITELLFSSSIHLPSSSIFVLTSILYNLIVNYSLLSTYFILKRFSLLIILSRLCLIITRIYTFIFLFRLDTWWLLISFFIIHLTFMITLLFDRSKFKHKQNTMFLQIIFSLIIHQSIDDISINALISLENISIFLHRLYLEMFSFYHDETTLRLIIFISILISLQIIGFTVDILSKNIRYRTKTITKL